MTALGAVLVALGVVLTIINRRFKLELSRGKVRGIAGPVLIIVGVLMLVGIIQG